ncbi:MAG: hypothetical protein US58_C0011G0002 [Candidatus Magasanikbacteria bacterium GW2011_GWA2_37_8]|uniref:DUF11 domain-containing protein n=1 Tax=Candidatus Magasanikbacteria bacterium GW2011_GWA2_37_8 TaxID=1619036 RepID=A0A0G0HQH3_9BACT|nr:MAG: hypothetical protein US58_C0011G0002 [Candidatus Magasanikbacteria bacterium GW2011_GWA2_37_8]
MNPFKFIYQVFHNHYHRRYHGIYQHAKKLFVIDLGLLALALTMLMAGVVLLFWKPGISDQIDLGISWGDTRIKSGEMVNFTVSYTNNSKFKLQDAVLAVHLPDGFVLDKNNNPEFSNQSTFDLDTLFPGAKGQKQISGWLWANVGTEEKIKALLTYTIEDTKNKDQRAATSIINLPDSVLQTKLSNFQTNVFGNEELKGNIEITNSGTENIPEYLIYASLNKAELKSKEISRGKNLASLATTLLEKQVIPLPLKIGDNLVYLSVYTNINNILKLQKTQTLTVKVLNPEIISNAKILTASKYIEPGQVVPVEINWKNTGTFTAKDLRIHLITTPGTVDLTKTAKENNLRIEGSDLIADTKTRTALGNSAPGSGDNFTVNVYLKPNFNLTSLDNPNWEIKPAMEFQLAAIDFAQKIVAPGSSATLPMSTELSWLVETRYFTIDGDQLGRGPLPPAVGQTTKYWVVVQIDNTINAVDNISFSATFMPGVTWTEKQSVTIGQNITYNETNSTVSWNYRELPATAQAGLFFEVAVTPNPEQIGQNLNLVKDFHLTATDSKTGKKFDLKKSIVTNVLPENDRGSGLGAKVIN